MKTRTRNRLMDSLYREELSINDVKLQLMLGFRIPARKAKRTAQELLQEAIEYWNSDVMDELY